MKVTYLAAAIVAAVGVSGTAHAAFTITEVGDGTPDTDLVDLPGTFTTDAGSASFQTNSVNNQYKSPYQNQGPGDTNNPNVDPNGASYFSVQKDSAATFNLSGSFLQLLWGSPDDRGGGSLTIDDKTVSSPDASRNFIRFFSDADGGGAIVGTVTAAELTTEGIFDEAEFASDQPDNGGWAWVRMTLDSDKYTEFKSVQFVNAGSNAMEIDGAVVPLPAAAWLMIGGLGAVGAYAWRSRKAVPTA